jgi:hypothetical protein
MNRIIVTLKVFLLFLIGITLLCSTSLRGAESKPFLADKHQSLGIACDQCHKENPPKEKVPTEVCMGCHGGYDQLPELTKKVIPNPHESHNGNLPCEACHHAHKASENQCLSCHDFNFKVP